MSRMAAVAALCPVLLFSVTARGGEARIDRNRIEPCPETPNCVSSRSTDLSHYAPPFQLKVPSDRAWVALRGILATEERMGIVEEARGDGYVHAEAVSLIFRFVDDVEFQILPEDHLIHVRSASRVGHWDFGVNRRRAERIRGRLQAAGIIK